VEIHDLHQHGAKGGAGKASPFSLLRWFWVFIPRTPIFLFPRNSSCCKNLVSVCMLFAPAFGFPCCLACAGQGTQRTTGASQTRLSSGSAPGQEGALWPVGLLSLGIALAACLNSSSSRRRRVLWEGTDHAFAGSSALPWPMAEGPPSTPRSVAPWGNGASQLRGMMLAASLSLAPASDGGNYGADLAGNSPRVALTGKGGKADVKLCPRKDIKDLALEKHHSVGLRPV